MYPSSALLPCLLLVLIPSMHPSKRSFTAALTTNGSRESHYQKTHRQEAPVLDHERLRTEISNGRVYQHLNFLSEKEVLYLIEEIQRLESDGKFETKGLSNSALSDNDQKFSRRFDRSICPIPWFDTEVVAHNGVSLDPPHTCNDPEGDDDDIREHIIVKLRKMRHEVSSVLDRPTIMNSTDGIHHEGYYSLSKVGSSLPRHMDERHEILTLLSQELKGSQGWLLPSRRSLSWLIYLSTPSDWDLGTNGGALRTYPQQANSDARSSVSLMSTHDGNLQVGWLSLGSSQSGDGMDAPMPVYMDSFYSVRSPTRDVEESGPHCILYSVINGSDEINDCKPRQRMYLTRPWMTEALNQGLSVMEFLKLCAEHDEAVTDNSSNNEVGRNTKEKQEQLLLFNSPSIAQQFSLIEDRAAWDHGSMPKNSVIKDIAPIRSSLVIFDSVVLPHEVLEIKSGTRRALAGWWHEKTQEFPTDFL